MADIPESTKLLTITQDDVTDDDRAAVTAFHTIQIKRIIAGDKTMGDNRDVIEQAFARHRIETEQRVISAALPDPVKLAERFCATPLPESVCVDLCATQPGPGRYGTNLMTVREASEVFRAALSTLTRAAPPAMDREAVARIIDPTSFCDVPYTDDPIMIDMVKTWQDAALAKADVILSTLSADAIRQGEEEVFTGVEAWDELVNVDDRTSPEEYPNMCLITRDELIEFMSRATPASHASDGGKA